ncbi:hypothetical protein IV203_002162 [Nitzschia inconspicua]|uniref:Uncharacterized protein n=1 Tax=Nitzschia inconspicua TaxID=303405 RepID=A0A9K3L922_9STRA|nr:hypothetical protein IV203_002162 [Nitzschia inconspicua]
MQQPEPQQEPQFRSILEAIHQHEQKVGRRITSEEMQLLEREMQRREEMQQQLRLEEMQMQQQQRREEMQMQQQQRREEMQMQQQQRREEMQHQQQKRREEMQHQLSAMQQSCNMVNLVACNNTWLVAQSTGNTVGPQPGPVSFQGQPPMESFQGASRSMQPNVADIHGPPPLTSFPSSSASMQPNVADIHGPPPLTSFPSSSASMQPNVADIHGPPPLTSFPSSSASKLPNVAPTYQRMECTPNSSGQQVVLAPLRIDHEASTDVNQGVGASMESESAPRLNVEREAKEGENAGQIAFSKPSPKELSFPGGRDYKQPPDDQLAEKTKCPANTKKGQTSIADNAPTNGARKTQKMPKAKPNVDASEWRCFFSEQTKGVSTIREEEPPAVENGDSIQRVWFDECWDWGHVESSLQKFANEAPGHDIAIVPYHEGESACLQYMKLRGGRILDAILSGLPQDEKIAFFSRHGSPAEGTKTMIPFLAIHALKKGTLPNLPDTVELREESGKTIRLELKSRSASWKKVACDLPGGGKAFVLTRRAPRRENLGSAFGNNSTLVLPVSDLPKLGNPAGRFEMSLIGGKLVTPNKACEFALEDQNTAIDILVEDEVWKKAKETLNKRPEIDNYLEWGKADSTTSEKYVSHVVPALMEQMLTYYEEEDEQPKVVAALFKSPDQAQAIEKELKNVVTEAYNNFKTPRMDRGRFNLAEEESIKSGKIYPQNAYLRETHLSLPPFGQDMGNNSISQYARATENTIYPPRTGQKRQFGEILYILDGLDSENEQPPSISLSPRSSEGPVVFLQGHEVARFCDNGLKIICAASYKRHKLQEFVHQLVKVHDDIRGMYENSDMYEMVDHKLRFVLEGIPQAKSLASGPGGSVDENFVVYLNNVLSLTEEAIAKVDQGCALTDLGTSEVRSVCLDLKKILLVISNRISNAGQEMSKIIGDECFIQMNEHQLEGVLFGRQELAFYLDGQRYPFHVFKDLSISDLNSDQDVEMLCIEYDIEAIDSCTG